MTLGSEQIVEMADRLAESILTLVRSGKLDHGDALQVITIASRLIQVTYPSPEPGEVFSIIQEAEAMLDMFVSPIGEA